MSRISCIQIGLLISNIFGGSNNGTVEEILDFDELPGYEDYLIAQTSFNDEQKNDPIGDSSKTVENVLIMFMLSIMVTEIILIIAVCIAKFIKFAKHYNVIIHESRDEETLV